MGFWASKIGESGPGLPRQGGSQVLQGKPPGTWWQAGTEHDSHGRHRAGHGGPPAQSVVSQPDYAPVEAESIAHTERCPRCGSREYAEFAPDLSMGGRSVPGIHAIKQCFDCRYPAFNASGNIIRGKGAVKADTVDSRRVRQTGDPRQGSWQGDLTFDSAPLVVS